MTYLALVILTVGATHRITRFLTADRFPPVAAARLRAGVWLREHLSLDWAVLPFCAWCASIYVAAGVVAVVDAFYSVPAPFLVWLTASGVTGLLSEFDSGDDDDTDTG